MLTNDFKDRAVAAAQALYDVIATWPDDVPEKANELAMAKSAILAISAAVVSPLVVEGYPNRYLRDTLTEDQQIWSDTVEPVNGMYATGATYKFKDQVRGAVDRPGYYLANIDAPVIWKHIGGDWFDAAGVAQGTKAFASLVVPAAAKSTNSVLEEDVTELAKLWVGPDKLPNWGMYVKGRNSNNVTFQSRYSADPTLVPQLVVTTSAGDVTLPAKRSITLNSSGYGTLAGKSYLTVSGADRAMLYFDLRGVSDVVSAKVRLSFFVGASYPCYGNTLDFYRVSNPAYADEKPKQELGLAAKYVADQGLVDDPDVVWMNNFNDPDFAHKWMGYISESGTPGWPLITDPAQRLGGIWNWLELSFKAGGLQGSLNAYAPLWRGFGNVKPLLPDMPEELYLRYYVHPIDWNWQPDGGKAPGFDMRGVALTGSYVKAGVTPVVVPQLLGMGRGNSGSGTDGFTGGSIRGNADREATPGSPLEVNFLGLGCGDCYHIDQSGPYGTNVQWDKGYQGQLLKDQPNCVELQVKMNDVTDPTQKPRRLLSIHQVGGLATATLAVPESDPKYVDGAVWTIGGVGLYNGYQLNQYQGPHAITPISDTQFTYKVDPATPAYASPGSTPGVPTWMLCAPSEGIPNGIVRGWVNGYLAKEQTNLRWRHSRYRPDGGIFGIDAGWLVFFEGGGKIPTRNATLRFANPVIATKYIGPMVLTP